MLDTIKQFNDTLAILALSFIVTLWVLHGRGFIELPGEVVGGTLTSFALIIQFYFRKSNGKDSDLS